MEHLDILIHVLTLLSGIMTALLGFLLYLKYRIKSIRYYSIFILTTTLTVALTTVTNYFSYNTDTGAYLFRQITGIFLFELFLLLINYSYSSFALGIINKPFLLLDKIFIAFPGLFLLLSGGTLIYSNLGQDEISIPPLLNSYFMMILACLFLALVLYSCRIAINLKKVNNPDLKRALKVLALFFLIYIPLQVLIINFNRQWMAIMLSRNLFYFMINVISITFAAKYFFVKTPSIMDRIVISENFLQKYAITPREKEVIELLMSGLSIKEISAKLDRSFKTVNNHIYNIYQKTQVSSKMELLNLIKENAL